MKSDQGLMKVYIVKDNYQYWEYSPNPDVFLKWINFLEDQAPPKTFYFQTEIVTLRDYEVTVKNLIQLNNPISQKPKPRLTLIEGNKE